MFDKINQNQHFPQQFQNNLKYISIAITRYGDKVEAKNGVDSEIEEFNYTEYKVHVTSYFT